MATNQMNVHRMKSIVVNRLFEELYAGEPEPERRKEPETKKK